MPLGFSAYPALNVQTPNIPAIMQQAQQGRLQEERLRLARQGQALDRQRLDMAREQLGMQRQAAETQARRQQKVAEGIKSYLTGEKSAKEAMLAVGPEGLDQFQKAVNVLSKLPDEERAAQRQTLQRAFGVVLGVESLPPEQREAAYRTQALPQLRALGIDAPPDYDPAWIRSKAFEGGVLFEALDEVERITRQPATENLPSGYRRAGEGRLEPIPGGPEDPETIGSQAAARRAKEGVNVVNFRLPDGKLVSVNENDAEAVQRLMDEGGVRISLGVQAADLSGLGLSQKDQQKARREAVKTLSNVEDGFNLLQKAREFGKGATGVRGAVGETLGGLTGQVSESLGEQVTGAITGISSEELSDFRAQARVFVNSRISTMTGEESGRYTEKERELANEAARVVETSANPNQIIGAIQSLMIAELLHAERDKIIGGHTTPNLHEDTPEAAREINRIGNELVRQGFSERAARDYLQRLRATHKALSGLY